MKVVLWAFAIAVFPVGVLCSILCQWTTHWRYWENPLSWPTRFVEFCVDIPRSLDYSEHSMEDY